MILSTNQELRLHVPSNAIDDVALLQGILDNSEKDFLKDKLGDSLYNRLCEYYKTIDTDEFFMDVTNGTYTQHPWNELLLNAQRMIANDAMARYAYQQLLSINGAGVNIASSNDYDAASEKLLDKGVAGYKKEAMVSLNNTLLLLETWAKDLNTPMPIDDVDVPDGGSSDDGGNSDNTTEEERKQEIGEIALLWHESKYYYLHCDLLVPTCSVLQQYIDVYENRDKFIRLIPDLRFIQEEYVEDAFGEDFVTEMLQAEDKDRLLRKVRRFIILLLEQRTTVLTIDKTRKQQAHNESVSVRESIQRIIEQREAEKQAKMDAAKASDGQDGASGDNVSGSSSASGSGSTSGSSSISEDNTSSGTDKQKGFKNNQPGSRIFVSPLLY